MDEVKQPSISDPKKEYEEFVTELESVMAKHGYRFNFKINFPQYNIFPDSLKLALNIIMEHKGKYQIVYEKIEKEGQKDANTA